MRPDSTPAERSLALAFAALCCLGGCEISLGARPDAGGGRDAARPDSAVLDAGVGDTPLLDGGPLDAPTMSDAPDAGPPPPTGRVRYESGLLHSPLTADLAEGLRIIAARGGRVENVLSRVGDSITRSTSFLNCFAGSRIDLAGRAELMATIAHFGAGRVGGENPFSRVSLAATVGWSASAALAAPAPIDAEIAAAHPGYASLMFGTNDVGFRSPQSYAADMLTLADRLIAAGAIPVLSSNPPRDDSASADARVPLFNAIVRGIAEGRGVPFVDLHAALLPLPNHGLLTSDRVHPNVFASGGCVFTAEGLGYGYNQRNWLVITALDRARRAVAGEPAPDASATRMEGAGTVAAPFVARSFPFTDLRSTDTDGTSRWASYPACSAANEGGPEVLYRVDVPRVGRLRAFVFDRGTVDVDVHVLSAADPTACLDRDDMESAIDVVPGTYWVAVDSYVDGSGAARSGEYLLVVLLE
jgi:hypothetical protein